MAYKWKYPGEWLKEKAQTWDREKLEQTLIELAMVLDSDEIQDLFASEMDADGYFEENSQ